MSTVLDVAAYILERKGAVLVWKLQKLVYYSQAWSLVWDDQPLFSEEIQAWINGPVCPDLHEKHKDKFELEKLNSGDSNNLNQEQKETIDAVLDSYGDQAPHWLRNLICTEPPWKKAREGLSMRERGNSVITIDSMADYYGSINQSDALPEDVQA